MKHFIEYEGGGIFMIIALLGCPLGALIVGDPSEDLNMRGIQGMLAFGLLLSVYLVLRLREELADKRQVQDIEAMLAYIDLHINTRYVTKQLTTEQKELYADLIDAHNDRMEGMDPQYPARHIDRWWRT